MGLYSERVRLLWYTLLSLFYWYADSEPSRIQLLSARSLGARLAWSRKSGRAIKSGRARLIDSILVVGSLGHLKRV
jgi:hypothetical protein